MAKLLLIIICVCTACIHLAWAQMLHKHAVELKQQGQYSPNHLANDFTYENRQNRLQSDDENRQSESVRRTRRHAGHSHADMHHDNEINTNTDRFIEKLFNEFSDNGDRTTMNLVQFDKMMKKLGLHRLIQDTQISSPEGSADSHVSDGHSNETVSNNQTIVKPPQY